MLITRALSEEESAWQQVSQTPIIRISHKGERQWIKVSHQWPGINKYCYLIITTTFYFEIWA